MMFKESNDKIPATLQVQKALRALEPIAPPHPQAWQEHRQTFLTEVSVMQQHQLKATPVVIKTPLTNIATNKKPTWRTLLKERSIMAIAIKAIVVLTLVFGGTLGTTSAAEASVPGSLLYPIKIQLENLQLNTAREPQRQAVLTLKFAQTRMDEVETLMNRGDEIPPEVAQRYQAQVEAAVQAGEALPEHLKEQIQDRIQNMLALHLETMTQLRLRTCEEECELEGPLQAMIRVMEQNQAKLGTQTGQGEGGPPDVPGFESAPKQGEGNGSGPDSGGGTSPDDKPGSENSNGPQGGTGPADDAGNDEAPAGEPNAGQPDGAGDGDQDGTCSGGGNCGDGEGDGNNGAGDNGGQDGGEPSGGDNSEGDNSGGDNGSDSGGDNGGDNGGDSGGDSGGGNDGGNGG